MREIEKIEKKHSNDDYVGCPLIILIINNFIILIYPSQTIFYLIVEKNISGKNCLEESHLDVRHVIDVIVFKKI